ncbi:MAG: CsbD family protein [Bacillota bacterium]
MNRDQVRGRGKELAGKVEKNVGRATGSSKTELKGAAKEAGGKVQKAFGDARKKTGS